MTSYVHTGASIDDLLDPAKNAGMRIVKIDQRSGATRASVLNAIAAEFPATEYPPLNNGNAELFRDILSWWMLNNWETWLEVEVLLIERDCRGQLTLLHDLAAAFQYAVDNAIHERASQQRFDGIADVAERFVLRMYVFEAG